MNPMELPIREYLPRIAAALKSSGKLILSSAPGSGKTTLVPPEVMKLTGKTVLLVEPRRVAARAAAARIAGMRGEKVGGVVGYRVRGDRAESPETRLLAVTPGVMLNLLQDDPLLEDCGAVIFDEFHERQWEIDLALAFLDDLGRSLGRAPLVVVMSATADNAALAEYLPDAALLEVPGRLHPIDIRWGENSSPDARSVAAETARAVLRARGETAGDLLVFLPGVREITAVQEMLENAIDPEKEVPMALHGSLPLAEQMRVLAPEARGRRKIILATNVAESSLTVDGVTGVVDSGLERRMEYDPGAGMSFLKLVRITRASADQRAGRAGRTAPGVAWRLWSKFDHAGRAPFRTPEILRSELSRLVLEVLTWGASPEKLRWLDQPPEAALNEAAALLRRLGAVDDAGLTPLGRRLARLPVHPRLGAMLVRAEKLGATELAIDLAARLEEHSAPERSAEITEIRPSRDAAVLKSELRRHFRRTSGAAPSVKVSPGVLLATAFPEWIARRRGASGGVYHLANGTDARLRPGDDLERCEFLAVARIGGSGGDAQTIQLAAPLDREELERNFADRIVTSVRTVFNPDTGRATAKQERKLGEIVLAEGAGIIDPAELARTVVEAALERELEIPPRSDAAARRLLDRVRFARRCDPEHYPDWNEENWKALWSRCAAASAVRTLAEVEKLPWLDVMRAELGRDTLRRLDREYPPVFKPPRGNEMKIDYSQDVPTLPVRIQALYTLDAHPCVGSKRLPLKLELLSPANRPVQLTSDLPGFWRGTWKIVRKEMKSRYPKHLWPEDPLHPDL